MYNFFIEWKSVVCFIYEYVTSKIISLLTFALFQVLFVNLLKAEDVLSKVLRGNLIGEIFSIGCRADQQLEDVF